MLDLEVQVAINNTLTDQILVIGEGRAILNGDNIDIIMEIRRILVLFLEYLIEVIVFLFLVDLDDPIG
jgi:hypothetical protein